MARVENQHRKMLWQAYEEVRQRWRDSDEVDGELVSAIKWNVSKRTVSYSWRRWCRWRSKS